MCNNSSCGCNFNRCTNLGPFVAVDADCITPPVGRAAGRIPFASGVTPLALTSLAGGLANIAGFVGFGTSVLNAAVLGTSIDLTGVLNEAFTVSTAGEITAISASFTVTTGITAGQNGRITAQIYRASGNSNTFLPTNAFVDLAPTLAGLVLNNTVSGVSSNFPPVTVSAGDRLLMVVSLRGSTLVAAVAGTVSAGIDIS